MERGQPTLVLDCRVGTMLDEESYKTKMTHFASLVERSRASLVLGCRVGALLNEEPREIKVTPS